MLIAVDHGNHAIKTIHYNFISGLARFLSDSIKA